MKALPARSTIRYVRMRQRRERKVVVIVQDKVPHYRVPFFTELRRLLDEENVTLRLLHAQAPLDSDDFTRSFYPDLDWAEPFKKLNLPNGATWYPILPAIEGSDLVIVEAASKRIQNYVLLILRSLGGPKLAFWGHGWSHKTPRPGALSERIKLWLGKHADWYFAYTWSVRQGLIQRGFRPDRITDVQNAAPRPPYPDHDLPPATAIRKKLKISGDAPIAVFCGRMYHYKRLPFAIRAAELVKATLPGFQLLLIGGGPDRHLAQEAAETHDYIRYLGPLFGKDKAEIFRVAHVTAMPGLVGLGVVDAFQHGVPPVATTYPFHSPEFAYLKDGINGLVADNTVTSFANALIRVLSNRDLRSRLERGCRLAAETITIEAMASRFAQGVMRALDQ